MSLTWNRQHSRTDPDKGVVDQTESPQDLVKVGYYKMLDTTDAQLPDKFDQPRT